MDGRIKQWSEQAQAYSCTQAVEGKSLRSGAFPRLCPVPLSTCLGVIMQLQRSSFTDRLYTLFAFNLKAPHLCLFSPLLLKQMIQSSSSLCSLCKDYGNCWISEAAKLHLRSMKKNKQIKRKPYVQNRIFWFALTNKPDEAKVWNIIFVHRNISGRWNQEGRANKGWRKMN